VVDAPLFEVCVTDNLLTDLSSCLQDQLVTGTVGKCELGSVDGIALSVDRNHWNLYAVDNVRILPCPKRFNIWEFKH
jgi:hypothetical protein